MKETLVKEIAVTAEVCGGTELSKAAVYVYLEELAGFEEADVIAALKQCRKEVRGRLALSDVLERVGELNRARRADEASRKLIEDCSRGERGSIPEDVRANMRKMLEREMP